MAVTTETARLLARLARSVPSASLAEIAAAGGCDETTARKTLDGLPARGRCSTIAAVLATSEDLVTAVSAARHHALPPPAAVAVSQHPSLAVRCSAGTALRRWKAALDTGSDRNAVAAGHPLSPPGLLRRAGHGAYGRVAYAAAGNPACPPVVLAALAMSHVGIPASGNPSCPAAVVAAVATGAGIDGAGSLPREDAAGNPVCPPVVLAALVRASHEKPEMRRKAADNPACPPEARALRPAGATDWEKQTKTKTEAADLACPEQALQRLGSHSSCWVRCAVASNPNCPPLVLASLVDDIDEDVRAAAAANPCVTSGTLAVLVDDRHWRVREAAAANPAIGPDVLAGAVASDDPYTRRGAAKNPACTLRMLVELTDDHESGASEVVAARLAATTRRHRPAHLTSST